MRRPQFILAVAVFSACVAAGAAADEQQAWRLFVADHTEPLMRAVDVEQGETIGTFTLESPASLYATQSGRTVFAVQRDGNRVSAFSSGIFMGDHGDHGDLEVEEPKRLDADQGGERPVHFVDHGGKVALFFDGEGVARILDEKAAHEGSPAVHEAKTAAPHHGVAVAWGDHVIISEPNPEDPSELPVGVRVVDGAGLPAGDLHACPGLHGEASSGGMLAIACETGLLIVTGGRAAPAIEHLAYSGALPDGKVSTLVGGRGLQYFLGNFGADAIVLIDPRDDEAFRLIDLPTRRVHFAVDPVRAKFAYVFTEDGRLHQVDVLAGEIARSITLTEPYSMDGHWSDPRPRIAVAGDEIAVTDPLKGLVHLIDAERFEKAREIAIDGRPFDIVAVGGSGEAHD